MEFVNLTRHAGIGANSYWLRVGGKSIILDAGSDPKVDGLGTTPDFSPVPEGSVDAIIITHAHQDHIGSLPFLTRREPQCPVFLTEPTAHITEIMLHNSVSVMTRQRDELNLPEYPLYTHRGVDFCEQQWVRCALRKRFNLSGEPSEDDNEVTFEFYHAGHILGSAPASPAPPKRNASAAASREPSRRVAPSPSPSSPSGKPRKSSPCSGKCGSAANSGTSPSTSAGSA